MEFDIGKMVAARAVLIAGPTASGKSALALDLADRLHGAGREPVIVNADSMQVYSGLRILTARPDEAELARFPHRLYGHADPAEAYSTGQWLRAVGELLAKMAEKEIPVIAGGTGLYFRALTEGFAAIPDIPDDVRASYRLQLSRAGPEALHVILAGRDPQAADQIKRSDAQRIVRALEVLEATGRSILDWQSRQAGDAVLPLDGVERFVVQPDRGRLYTSIDQRFDRMVEAGAVAEVQQFLSLGLDPDLPAMKAIGVREFSQVLSNQLALADAIALAKTRTRQYAKRQMTWMRNQMSDWPRIR